MNRAWVVVVALGVGLGVGLAIPRMLAPAPAPEVPGPDPRTVIERMRDVARLETLEVRVYKKVAFEEEPRKAESGWQDLANWVKQQVKPVRGKAIVFGTAHVQLEVNQLQARVDRRVVHVVLPPARTHVELHPQETEVMLNENLTPEALGQLMALAKAQMERDVAADAALKARALGNARNALRAMLADMGIGEVRFVEQLPVDPPRG